MLILFGLGAVIGLYFLLLRILPLFLYPEVVRHPLQWAHRASAILIPGAVLVSGIWNLHIRYPMLFTLVVVGSGLVGGLRAKLEVISEWARPFARTQMIMTPILTPVLFLWAVFSTEDVVYSDAHVTVEVSTHTGWMSGITSTRVTLYQACGILFDKHVGDIGVGESREYGVGEPDFKQKEWWQTVRWVTFNTVTLTGVVQQVQGSYPFGVERAWRKVPPPPAETSAPAPGGFPTVEDR
ncbi:hypothetical protein ACFST9_10615 [Hymenobacter monticola]|uniref:Uncharacterized protein n=1 Tax=Hymenobacter monticola TaxID=1705399 RepID=A0ABY4B8Z7_9BACT|nr:hypothetical protein [Hymenobacter monticola]UOE35349.1 hypothetical protein MTP16_06790 [Hymenobacter monticola]